MKRRQVILHGQTDKGGNFLMANRAEMQEFFKSWPGTFFTMQIEVTPTAPLSRPLQAYYYKKVVPDMQHAFSAVEGLRLTPAQTDERLRAASPIMQHQEYNEAAGKWETQLLDLRHLDNQQLVFFIEHLKEMAAEEYGVYIEDPGVFNRASDER